MPTAVILGKRGVGKSSTMNRLFGLQLETDAARECTIRPSACVVPDRGGRQWRVVDMPGIAANLSSAARYGRHYRRWLALADVVVWITQANVRAYRQDQIFFQTHRRYVRPGTRLVLAISKFDTQLDELPDATFAASPAQQLIDRKLDDVAELILPYAWATRAETRTVPYSVSQGWNLEALSHAIFTS